MTLFCAFTHKNTLRWFKPFQEHNTRTTGLSMRSAPMSLPDICLETVCEMLCIQDRWGSCVISKRWKRLVETTKIQRITFLDELVHVPIYPASIAHTRMICATIKNFCKAPRGAIPHQINSKLMYNSISSIIQHQLLIHDNL